MADGTLPYWVCETSAVEDHLALNLKQWHTCVEKTVSSFISTRNENGVGRREAVIAKAAWQALQAKSTICRTTITDIAFRGIPSDLPQIQAVYWKLLLGYLPFHQSEWPQFLLAQRALYKALVLQCIDTETYEAKLKKLVAAGLRESSSSPVRSPLSSKEAQVYSAEQRARLAQDAEVFDQISKDIARTRADNSLFRRKLASVIQTDSTSIDLQYSEEPVQQNPGVAALIELHHPQTYLDILGRLLYVYSKTFPATKYTQGMNELVAPLFYVFARDTCWNADDFQLEADLFFCFQALLQRFSLDTSFCRNRDGTLGVIQRVQLLNQLLSRHDPALHLHFKALHLDAQFFALRWLLLLLTQEFSLPTCARLWDALLADRYDRDVSPNGWLLYYICLAALDLLRDRLVNSDFCACMTLLQQMPQSCPEKLINSALAIRERLAAQVEHWEPRCGSRANAIVNQTTAYEGVEDSKGIASIGSELAKNAFGSLASWLGNATTNTFLTEDVSLFPNIYTTTTRPQPNPDAPVQVLGCRHGVRRSVDRNRRTRNAVPKTSQKPVVSPPTLTSLPARSPELLDFSRQPFAETE